MWAFGRFDLHLGEDEFWGLTLREFNALSERHKDNQDWLNYRSALICAVMANMWRGKNTKAFIPNDFMPKKEHKGQTAEQMLFTVKMLNAAFGGTISED